jgi:hypothetical protein
MYGDFLAKNTACTPYMPINVWFWPTLTTCIRKYKQKQKQHTEPQATHVNYKPVCVLLSGALCYATVSRHCVMPLCHATVSRHCVTPLCHATVSRHCVTPLCYATVSRHCFQVHCVTLDSNFKVPFLRWLIIHRVGQNHLHIRCVYVIFGRDITKHTVTYGAYIWFWPT